MIVRIRGEMILSVDEALQAIQASSGMEWEVSKLQDRVPDEPFAVVFRSEAHDPRFEDILFNGGFKCPLNSRGGYYAGGIGGIYFDVTVEAAVHRFNKQTENRHIFLLTVPIPRETIHINFDNRLDVMRSPVVRDRLVYGISQRAPQNAEYIKAVAPGHWFIPNTFLLLRPKDDGGQGTSSDSRQDADSKVEQVVEQ